MNIIAEKTSKLHGGITIPGSKSQTIRGLLIATLAKGTSVISNVLEANDTRTAINVCKKLGSQISKRGQSLIIKSNGLPLKPKTGLINTGDSGITTRFVMPVLGLRQNFQQVIKLDCGAQMKARPVLPLLSALHRLGMRSHELKKAGCLPQVISGQLRGGKTTINGLTSQYLSALLI